MKTDAVIKESIQARRKAVGVSVHHLAMKSGYTGLAGYLRDPDASAVHSQLVAVDEVLIVLEKKER